METDKETKQVLAENASVKSTLESPGWEIIERTFFEYLNAFDSISNYTAVNPEDLVKEIVVNRKVMETLKIFWNDIQGRADTSGDMNNILKEEEDSGFMLYKD